MIERLFESPESLRLIAVIALAAFAAGGVIDAADVPGRCPP